MGSDNFVSGSFSGLWNYANGNFAISSGRTTINGFGKRAMAELIGANIKIYVDDMTTPAIDYTDPMPFISGKAGIRVHAANMSFDNFLIFASPGTALPLVLIRSPQSQFAK